MRLCFGRILSNDPYSESGLYYIWGECGEEVITEPKAINDFHSFHEIYSHSQQITHKTLNPMDYKNIHISNGKYSSES